MGVSLCDASSTRARLPLMKIDCLRVSATPTRWFVSSCSPMIHDVTFASSGSRIAGFGIGMMELGIGQHKTQDAGVSAAAWKKI